MVSYYCVNILFFSLPHSAVNFYERKGNLTLRIFTENNTIKIRREGIFLCLDGSKADSPSTANVLKTLSNFIKIQCRNFDIPFKMGLLSWDKELEAPPSADFLSSNTISKRGRFITPLAEDMFSLLEEKAYDLIIVASDTIYDLEDWRNEISSRFNMIYERNLKDLEQKTQLQWEEEFLNTVFNFQIDKVALSFDDSLPYSFPNDFRIKIIGGKTILEKECKSRLVDIELKTCGTRKEARFILDTCNSSVERHIENTLPEVCLIDNEFDDNQKGIFLSALEDYKRREPAHQCPLCQCKHKFSRAFICSQQKSSTQIFATESVIFREIESKRREDARYVVFHSVNGKVCWRVAEKPVICVNSNNLVVMPDEGSVSCVKISDRVEVIPCGELHRGLFSSPDGEIYVLRLR